MLRFAWLLGCCGALLAQAPSDLSEVLQPLVKKHEVPALGAAVIDRGQLVAIGAAGVRKVGDPTPVTSADLWHLGSCTKAMTATLLARFVERGELQWNTTVAAGLPDLADGMDPAARQITVEQLLSHHSGLPGGPPPALWSKLFHYTGTTTAARTEVAAAMLAVAPEATPGSRYLYSNAGYMIAGAIAERLGHDSWEHLLQQQVFAPLQMQSAGFGPPGRADAVVQPFGHRAGKPPSPIAPGPEADNPPALGPAGTVHCSLADWSRFALLHLGCASGDAAIVTPTTLQALHTARGDGYGLGWGVTARPWAKGPVLSHSGSNTIWYCVIWAAPEEHFAVLVTCNQGDAGAACDDVAATLIRRFHPKASK